MGSEKGKIDFGTSETWGKYYAESQAPKKLKHIKREPTIKVAGMTLHNIDPDAPVDETNDEKLKENLKKLGVLPVAEKPPETPPYPLEGKTDFLDLVPAEAPKTKLTTKGRQPKKIHPPSTQPDDEQFMQIDTNPRLRRRAQGSDARREAAEEIERRRIKYGLPAKSLFTWKERHQQLADKQLAALENVGFENARNIHPGTWAYEKMLMTLYQPSRKV
ncbi:MAG: hypothetical protein NT149_04950 [Candidatus Gottesmanbacteria bacterium]|nr:hypothetical protein [Candidatus Gottesmanbacteria bacterium]